MTWTQSSRRCSTGSPIGDATAGQLRVPGDFGADDVAAQLELDAPATRAVTGDRPGHALLPPIPLGAHHNTHREAGQYELRRRRLVCRRVPARR